MFSVPGGELVLPDGCESFSTPNKRGVETRPNRRIPGNDALPPAWAVEEEPVVDSDGLGSGTCMC